MHIIVLERKSIKPKTNIKITALIMKKKLIMKKCPYNRGGLSWGYNSLVKEVYF
jgi:hypothetical protein